VSDGLVPPTLNGGSKVLSDVLVELGFAPRDVVEEAVRAAQSPGTPVAGVDELGRGPRRWPLGEKWPSHRGSSIGPKRRIWTAHAATYPD
jgi:hypothetical protein